MSATAAQTKPKRAVRKSHKPDQVTQPGCLLTKKQLAATLPMSERMIEKLQANRVIPALKITPRMVRYELAAVLDALRQRQTATLK